ncbi:ribonuclease H [Bifidobacterium lemurum]|uniref:ribonuclease H n=1 Tax=Bifidobacterium lemurum TaxID=1603886 RepID=A0A261FVC3_9BIFI|nr:ribonuclease H [Bifidobacterium lemurum]OZG63137.1 ribonuclease H [Bifidobacterium lemurum]QOL33466.1 ribonuclease HI [Bifidobacterium lemurum]
MTITVSTDGSALANPNGPMGWAWADHTPHAGGTPGHEHPGDCDAGGATNGTNQIGELCAVLEALRAHPGAEPLVIETDSQYAINCSTTWVKGWKKNGWKNSQKKPVKNAQIIKAIDEEIGAREGSVRFVWVKGHAGNAGNEKVDELARTFAEDCRSGVRDGYLPREGWQSLIASEYSKGLDIPSDARMLLDGAITPEDYHLGRGADSPGESDSPNGGESAERHPRAILEPEPEGVPDLPDYGRSKEDKENDASPTDAFGTGPDGFAEEPRTGEPSIGNDGEPTGDHAESTAGAEGEANGEEASIPSEDTDASTDANASEEATASQEAAVTGAPAQPRLLPTGLMVSGALRFSPAPKTSPFFTGRPLPVRGVIEIEGLVDGDGNLVITNAPFLRENPGGAS